MSRPSVFHAKSYKAFIHEWIKKTPTGGRGQRKLLADAVGCQTPYITHVLSGDYHFSLEQAEGCARWMGLNESETEFFLLLVMRERAGTRALKSVFERQIETYRAKELAIKKKVQIEETLDLQAQVTYYSHWLYAAVHMAILIPTLNTADALQNYFQVPSAQLMSVLDFLARHRLIEPTRAGYKVARPMLFLPRGSPLLPLHHSHWRLMAIEKSQMNRVENMHYSTVMSLSRDAYEAIRIQMAELIEKTAEIVKPSADEKLACMVIDLFNV